MLALICSVGKDRYAFDGDGIIEVVPAVDLKALSNVPSFVAGLMNFQGKPLVVVDFSQLIDKRPCENVLHTRIILLRSPLKEGDILGLKAEKITEIVDRPKEDFSLPGDFFSDFPFLEGISQNQSESVRLVSIEKLFKYVESLFKTEAVL